MKLYTEEQMHTVMLLALGKYQIHSNKKVLKHNQELLDSLTPIELPGHFEILDEARKEESSKEQYAFIRAVRWISNKIEGDNK